MEKVPTYIKCPDEVLSGGIRKGKMNFLEGASGTGKPVFCGGANTKKISSGLKLTKNDSSPAVNSGYNLFL